MTDAPYSLRHIAELYRAHGFVAVVMRMPGHGTVPAGLTKAVWEDWMAATRLGVREAVARAGAGAPLHIVGYSNGGALAVKYALDAIGDDRLAKPDRLVLLSPMIGVTRFARFSGLAALPAIFPPFIKAAWLNILPEYNPFKYNSFPVNAATQTYELTTELQSEIEATVRRGEIGRLPPILAFQSAIDFTVSARAVVNALYDRLAANGSELVLFDVNRAANVEDLLRESADTAVERLLPLASAKVPRHRDRQCGTGRAGRGRAHGRPRRDYRDRSPARGRLSGGRVLDVPHRPALPAVRRSLRFAARSR